MNALIWYEQGWYLAQCIEVDIASQGNCIEEAIQNLEEALKLSIQSPSNSFIRAYASSCEDAIKNRLEAKLYKLNSDYIYGKI